MAKKSNLLHERIVYKPFEYPQAYEYWLNQQQAHWLHTEVRDENGTDLQAVKEMLFGNEKKYNIIFDSNKYPSNVMNLLYNATDGCALIILKH